MKYFNKILLIKKSKFILTLIYAIILVGKVGYGEERLNVREFEFEGKSLKVYTEAIRYHVKANGYTSKYREEVDNNFYRYISGPGRELEEERSKMIGYGNYVMKPDTSLFGFIEYCNLVDSERCEVVSRYLSPSNINYCDYERLISYAGQVLSGIKATHMNNFWALMSSENFNKYQDIYYYCYYTNKVVRLTGFSLDALSKIRDNAENGSKEFLTACTTYSYAIGKDSGPKLEIKKGDIVPFLYVKERRNEENDSDIDEEEFKLLKKNPYEIARYAYVALIEGWVDGIDDNNLWKKEYKILFGEEYNNKNLIASVNTLSEWYTKTKDKYKREKGKKGNNLIGSNLDTIIESDYSIEEQVEAVDHYLKSIGGIGDYKSNMARNELMAKYMMEKSKIDETIKDYSVGINFITEKLQRGTEL